MKENTEYINTFAFNPLEFPFNIAESGITIASHAKNHIIRSKCYCHILEYIISGNGTVICNGHKEYVKAGDAYLLPKGLDHEYYPLDGWKKIWFNIDGILVDNLISAFNLKNNIVFHNFQHIDLFEEMYAITNNKKKSTQEIFYEASEYFYKIVMNMHIMIDFPFKNNKLNEIKNRLDANIYKKNISIEEISKALDISEVYINKLFKDAFNTTPHQYYIKRKIDTAASMLITTDLTITEISEHLKFTDQSYFSKVFKKIIGVTPYTYRKTNMSNSQAQSNRTNKENFNFYENPEYKIDYQKH